MKPFYTAMWVSVGLLGLASILFPVNPAAAACAPESVSSICPPPAPAPAEPALLDAKVRLFELVNRDRVAGGLAPLLLRDDLDTIAAEHSLRMSVDGGIFHNDELFTAATKSRLGAKSVGENVATNLSVDDAHRRLMASPGHRSNLMSAAFSRLGLGLANVNGAWYITQVFIEPRDPLAAGEDEAALEAGPVQAETLQAAEALQVPVHVAVQPVAVEAVAVRPPPTAVPTSAPAPASAPTAAPPATGATRQRAQALAIASGRAPSGSGAGDGFAGLLLRAVALAGAVAVAGTAIGKRRWFD